MIETHPFGDFVPVRCRYLLLGSFAAKRAEGYDWFYSNGRNHFWPIMESVYGIKLPNTNRKKKLFEDLEMAMADIIFSCRRSDNSNLDTKLTDITYNTSGIEEIICVNNIDKIYFTSRFVESHFKKHFVKIASEYTEEKLLYLPSPSPRYAAMRIEEKIKTYKELLPKLRV